jgi:UDP-N-acetylglucosamine 2-epimerase (non-hydrolysing)/GDP/UDP-N,N'-diacetylbacillosamine 2-epimerase (hydrolysing)
MKQKISITTGTRSEYGILRELIKEISKSKKLELYLLVTGMHLSKKFGYTINEIKKDKIPIHAKIKMIPSGNTPYDMSVSLGKGIVGFSKIFKKIKPDLNVVLGDRDEALASALAASHMNIPNAHIHGGEISQGIDEYNRHAITKISNIHFAATKKSKERIIKMGENRRNVILTGSPSIDEIKMSKISSKHELEKKYLVDLDNPLFLLIQHSVTTEFEKSDLQIKMTLDALSKLKNQTIAILPNSDAGSEQIINQLRIFSKKCNFLKVFPNLPRNDYLGFLRHCSALIGNSSSGLIEGSYLHTPVVNIGIRQLGREKDVNVIDVPIFSKSLILNALKKSLKKKNKKIKNSSIYGTGNASKKIVQYLETISINPRMIQKKLVY